MRARRWGRIVNISSIGARIGAGTVSVAYGASKAGVEGLTRAYALRARDFTRNGQLRGAGFGRYGYGQAREP
jgi:NAD(P)-dependent dehydrogenase (short-subunit alcohol dehydrogenase family)